MPEDLELLRLRAKAKLRLRSQVNSAPGDVTAGATSTGSEYLTEAQKDFRSESIPSRMLAGAGKVAYSTPGVPAVTDLLTKGRIPEAPQIGPGAPGYGTLGGTSYEGPTEREKELKGTFGAYEKASEGDIAAGTGELLGDVGMMAVPGARLSKAKGISTLGKGLLGGGGSAVLHQAQRGTEGKDISLGGAGAEIALSTALPYGGSKIGQGLKKVAPDMLRSAVKPARKFMESVNPPNFVKPLEDKLITKFGGLEKGVEKTTAAVKKLAEKRDNLIKSENITVNITDATRKVGKKLNDMVKNAEIDFEDAQGAFKHSEGALGTAKKISGMIQSQKPKASLMPNAVKKKVFNKTSVSGEDAIKIRKLADKNSKFNPMQGITSKQTFNEAYRRVIEDEIEAGITKKAGGAVSSQYKALKKEMADLIPFQKAGQFRLGQLGNNYQFSLMDMGAMGVGGAMGGAPAALGATGLRRLTQTPGGAAMLYSAGKRLDTPSLPKSLLMQGSRSLLNQRLQ